MLWMTRITPEVPAAVLRLRQMFGEIEKTARMSGNGEILLELDRIQCQFLGPANSISQEKVDEAQRVAYEALIAITERLEKRDTPAKG